MSNTSQCCSRSYHMLKSAGLAALLAAAAQVRAAENYVADVWIESAKVAEVNLNLKRGASGDITRLEAGTTVREPGFAAYSINQVSEQIWSGGRLQYFTSTSYGRGDERRVELNGHDGGIAGLADDSTVDLPATAVPATLWCDYVAKTGVLFDPVDATLLTVDVTNLGDEELLVGGKPVTAVRHEFSGDWVRTIWYATNGLFVQAVFHDHGHEVRVTLRSLEPVE